MTKEQKSQFTLRITQANSNQLIVILYEMTLCYLEDGKSAYNNSNMIEFEEAIRKARGCINELIQSLHFEYEIANALVQLYFYCIRSLAKASFKKDMVFLDEVSKVIVQLKEAYEEVGKDCKDGPIMENVPTLYSGFCYGKNQMNQEFDMQNSNRGMFA